MNEDDKKPHDVSDNPKPGNGDDKPNSGHHDKPENGDDKPGGGKPTPPESLPIHFKVNNVDLVSEREKLVALDILVMAGEYGAIGDKPDKYILEDKYGEKKRYKSDDWVSLREGEEFLAVLNSQGTAANG